MTCVGKASCRNTRFSGIVSNITIMTLVAMMSGCSTFAPDFGGSTVLSTLERPGGSPRPVGYAATRLGAAAATGNNTVPIIDRGEEGGGATNINTIDPELALVAVELAFVDTDVREFARVLFSELLNRPYVLDQGVSGVVTLRSGGRVDGNAALALAKQALAASGNTIFLSQGIYRVTNAGGAGAGVAGNLTNIRLKYINAQAAQQALLPLLNGRAEIVAIQGTTLSLRGDPETVALVDSLIKLIDVDQFKASSFGLFPLANSDVEAISSELETLYSGAGVTGVTMLPIVRLNTLLIIAKRASHLDFAQKWIKRLDKAASNKARINIYKVQHRQAENLAALLSNIFVDAGISGVSISDSPPDFQGEVFSPEQQPFTPVSSPTSNKGIRITADDQSNTLVVWAQPAEYELIERALLRLDVPLQQVYIEATIAEVRLGNELSHGVKWFVESELFSASLIDNSVGSLGPEYPGFNFSFRVPQAQIVLSALETYTDVKIVSSPTLTVLDRQTATIQVGDQVPIVTKSVQNTSSGNNIIANDVEFRDTGIILKVTPTIRDSGDVILEIEQEVSRVLSTTSSQINSPTISQRKISSTVSVPDGVAIVLGGLINENADQAGGGLPGTQRTILESIFGTKKTTWSRSELLVFIRPIIIRDRSDLREIVREIAEKMPLISQTKVN